MHIKDYAPNFLRDILEFELIYDIENDELQELYSIMKQIGADAFIQTASEHRITQIENFLKIKGQGTLSQRRDYLLVLFQKSTKLNENAIKTIVNTLAEADCIIEFFGSDDPLNPNYNYPLLRVQVLSPDSEKDYRYEDIERALKLLTPAHILLLVLKHFATWENIMNNYTSWNDIYTNVQDWQEIYDTLPEEG